MTISTFLMFALIFVTGLFGSVWLARKYTGRIAQVILTVTGALCLWIIAVVIYGSFISSPVPKILGFLIFPLVSLIIMAVVIQRVPKLDQKQKRKHSS